MCVCGLHCGSVCVFMCVLYKYNVGGAKEKGLIKLFSSA